MPGTWVVTIRQWQDVHETTPQGMSSHPVMEFMAEVEDILLSNDLL